jgi:catechol 2,3-dioxygenase-like lactoylglutathione lyase family enzyme
MIKRIVPNLNVTDASAGHEFYVDLLGMEKELDLGWIVRFQAPSNQAALVSLVSGTPAPAKTRWSRLVYPMSTRSTPAHSGWAMRSSIPDR